MLSFLHFYLAYYEILIIQVRKIGDEYFTFIEQCKDPKACTILLRGASKDILNEVERNLQDAIHVARNICLDPFLVPGGGAVEMEVSHHLKEKSNDIYGISQLPYRDIAAALEIIPKTLAQNCGANVIRTMTMLSAKHAEGFATFGINGLTGKVNLIIESNYVLAHGHILYEVYIIDT